MTAVAAENTNSNAEAVVADAEQTQEERFKWRSYVHYGTGAVECEHGTDGKCQDQEHFHALCRLPTPFQIRDIQEKAAAAKARRLRMLRDTDSDAHVILEDEMHMLADIPKEIIADELLEREFTETYTNAVREVDEIEDPDFVPKDDEDIPKLYATIDQDREEYMRQRELPEDQRADDFPELERTYTAYSTAIEEAMDRLSQPRRDYLMSLEVDELVEMVRRERMEAQGYEAHLHTFNMWQMYVCTLKPVQKGVPRERVWNTLEDMKYNEDSNVLLEVRRTFEAMEHSLAQTRMGKG